MSAALAKAGGGFTLAPSNWRELMEFAELAAKSDLVPKDYRGKPANVALAVQWGGELGIGPMQALQNIAVINGRPGLWGDIMIALCSAHPDYVDTVETYDEKTMTATCIAKRRGRSDKTATFSAEDVKRAGLGSTHNTYPKRMKQFRARGFALRDQWSDVLKGIISAEERQDTPPDIRAEVVEPAAVQAPQTLPPLVLTEDRLRGLGKGPLAGRVLEECTCAELGHYIAAIEKLPKAQRDRFAEHLEAVGKVFEAVAVREMDAKKAEQQPPAAAEPDPIVEGLEREVKRLREPVTQFRDDDDSYLSGGTP